MNAKAIWICAMLAAAPLSGAATAQSPEAAHADYGVEANWLCRPERAGDACTQDQTAAVIAADGAMSHEIFTPSADPPIDCFYVYPTVSLDPGVNSDLIPGREELSVIQMQFARFAAQCRTFAPMYRQNTLASLRARTGAGGPTPPDRTIAYNDVAAAWRHYLANDNHGRGVVLMGHSQGAALLIQLIRNEIDGKPVQALLVSAIILGAHVIVPDGADVGGSFQHIPPCRETAQTGCVVSYVSFRASAPPPAAGIFAHPIDSWTGQHIAGAHALCTNPASLAGGAGPLNSYFPTAEQVTPAGFAWTRAQQEIEAPFVSTPGLASAQCVTDGPAAYLAIHINAEAEDVRTHDIPGDVIVNGRLLPDWGLHRVDVSVAIGNLVAIVGEQAAAYAALRN